MSFYTEELGAILLDFLNGNFFAAFIGAMIGGFFTLWGTRIAHALDQKREAREAIEQELRLLQALHDECEAVWNRYEKNLGGELMGLNVNEPLTSIFPIYSDFFPVYKGSTALIGLIQNEEVRKGIVQVYTQGCGMIDMFTLNNALIQDWVAKVEAHKQAPTSDSASECNNSLSILVDYTVKLKGGHEEIQKLVAEVLTVMRREIEIKKSMLIKA